MVGIFVGECFANRRHCGPYESERVATLILRRRRNDYERNVGLLDCIPHTRGGYNTISRLGDHFGQMRLEDRREALIDGIDVFLFYVDAHYGKTSMREAGYHARTELSQAHYRNLIHSSFIAFHFHYLSISLSSKATSTASVFLVQSL